MKLLVVTAGLECSTLDPVSGWMHELTARLAARGHRVTVLCTRASDGHDASLDPSHDSSSDPSRHPAGVTVWRPAAEDRTSALTGLLVLDPDVVHVAAPGPVPAEFIAALAGRPLLIDLLDWSALCPAGDLLARPLGEECTRHHPAAPCGACIGHAHVRAMEPFIAFARAGHRAVAHASHVRDRSTFALGRGVSLVPMGVDATRFTPEPAAPLSPEVAALVSDRSRQRVVSLGPPTPARGGPRLLDLLVALHARVPGVELVVPGIDPDNPDLLHVHLAEAKELGIASQLVPLPRVSRADLPALLAACDVGVLPGLAPEALGRAAVEALAVGLPVVAHPSPTMHELLLGGEAGVLASALPMARFADAVAALLADRSARTALGERARLAALERHDVERAIVDTEALYESIRAARHRESNAPRRKAA